MVQLDLLLRIYFVHKSVVADEPYFSQLGSIQEMTALKVCMGMKSYGRLQ